MFRLAPAEIQMVLVAGVSEHARLPGEVWPRQPDLARPPGRGHSDGLGRQVPCRLGVQGDYLAVDGVDVEALPYQWLLMRSLRGPGSVPSESSKQGD